jgi:1,5-anhydro-D-fructose reductase (1,5-anhydro-D-mannitol-forming)
VTRRYEHVRWGIVGCGDVTEVKSGPGFYKAAGSSLVAVMRRDRAKAEDYARRHGVPRVHATAEDLIADPDVDAVYIATPPVSHCALARRVAEAGKPCLVEKPMAMTSVECLDMLEAFAAAGVPLWVAYYRRALPRFLLVRDLVRQGAIGTLTSIRVEIAQPLAAPDVVSTWRFDPLVSGGGLLFDVGSHSLDLVDFLAGPIVEGQGFSTNTGGAYAAADLTVASFACDGGILGTGVWNFNAAHGCDELRLSGTTGAIVTSILGDADVRVIAADGDVTAHTVRNPPHVHQPLIQSIVDELGGRGTCESTGVSGARTSRVLDQVTPGHAG